MGRTFFVPIPPPPLPPALPIVISAPCPAYAPDAPVQACAIPARNLLYVNPGYRDAEPERTIQHEIGHFADKQVLDDTERWQFRVMVKAPVWTDHSQDTIEANLRTNGDEQFADAYAHCRMGDVPPKGKPTSDNYLVKWWSSTAYKPTRKQSRRVCRWMLKATAS